MFSCRSWDPDIFLPAQQWSPPSSASRSEVIFITHLHLPVRFPWTLRAEDNLLPVVHGNVQPKTNYCYLFFLPLISSPFTLHPSPFTFHQDFWISSEYQRIYEYLWALEKDYRISCMWRLRKSKLRKERMCLLEAGDREGTEWENASKKVVSARLEEWAFVIPSTCW